ncbi:MAG: desulfoferrodoxin [Bacteroidales bacterium]|nr:desulfoferrodoxin [Bacteroidales bacterium]
MATKFFLCSTCGNVVVKVVDSGVTPVCCGNPMRELIPDTVGGVYEKHLPVVEFLDEHTIKAKVGSTPHPMMIEHHIVFIYLETRNGGQIHYLKPEEKAEAVFTICNDEPVAVYEFCNLHGLWKTEIHQAR